MDNLISPRERAKQAISEAKATFKKAIADAPENEKELTRQHILSWMFITGRSTKQVKQ